MAVSIKKISFLICLSEREQKSYRNDVGKHMTRMQRIGLKKGQVGPDAREYARIRVMCVPTPEGNFVKRNKKRLPFETAFLLKQYFVLINTGNVPA
jgi:hypothetical protein